MARFVASSLFLALAALVGLDAYTATHHIDSGGIAGSCAFQLFSDRLTPLAGGIRDGAHPRGAPPPHCPGSAPAHSVARVRPWPTISRSGSRCSSPRTSTGSPADAVRRSPRHGQGIPVESIQSRARHKRFARASVAQRPLPGCPTSWPDAKIVLHRLGLGHGSDGVGPPPARTPPSVAAQSNPRSDVP